MGSDVNKFYFRLVLLGSNGTGKTSILNRFLFKKFEAKHKPTVEDLFTKEFDLGSIEIKVDFLDTSGSMQFPAMRRLSITNGDAFLIVYALDDENSFEVLKMCIAEIQETRKHDYQEIPIVFVGNKSDLPRDMRRVPKELVSNYVYYELPRLRTKVIECSCKEDVNIETIFRAYLSLARVSMSPPAYGPGSGCGAGGGKGFAMTTIDSGGSGGGSGRNSRNNSGKRRPASAVPQIGEHEETGVPNQRSRHNSGSGGGGGGYSSSSSSFRVALGVRKSCDASIVTSMRRISLSSKNSRDQLETTRELHSGDGQSNDKHNNNNNNNNNNNHSNNNNNDSSHCHNNNQEQTTEGHLEEFDYDLDEAGDNRRPLERQQNPQKSSIESILKAAQMQNSQSNSRLHVKNHEAKPRSRSLIWRPNRKTSQSSAANDKSECRIS